MTILAACQEAAKLLRPGQAIPTSVFSSADTFARELAALSNEAARAIANAKDWRTLMVLKTESGDGVTTAFSFPSDYDRFPLDGMVYSTSYQLPLEKVDDEQEWLDREIRSFIGSIGYWIVLGGAMNIKGSGGAAMAVGESAKYYYLSKYIVTNEGAVTQEEFTADTDSFRLPERLLTLELIWRWRHRKGFDYGEDMRNAEIARAEEFAKEKGRRTISVGRARLPSGVTLAFNGVINAS